MEIPPGSRIMGSRTPQTRRTTISDSSVTVASNAFERRSWEMPSQQIHDFTVTSSSGPGEWFGPRWIVRQSWFGAAVEEEVHHLGPAEFRRPAQWRGADVFVARVQVGAAVEEPGGFL